MGSTQYISGLFFRQPIHDTSVPQQSYLLKLKPPIDYDFFYCTHLMFGVTPPVFS